LVRTGLRINAKLKQMRETRPQDFTFLPRHGRGGDPASGHDEGANRRPKRDRTDQTAPPIRFQVGDRVSVEVAGGDRTGKITSRRLSNGHESIHPANDDTAVFVMFDDTGISMPVSMRQVVRLT
jgi:hypothetical protein